MNSRGFALASVALLAAACAPATDSDAPEPIESGASAIINGTPATDFPEAVLVDIQQQGQTVMGCSGSLIAPRVVLTAAHCVADGDGWQITAPYGGGQTAHASSSATYDWQGQNNQVSPNEHDVGLVFLDSPITLSSYPTVANAAIPDGTEIVTVGRVKGGQLSHNALYKSPPGKMKSASSYGFPYDYASPMMIEHGDSGGAAYVKNTHTIVSVNSTGNSTTQILARVDLLSSWIAGHVASHGGVGGSDPGVGGGDPGGEGGSDPGVGGGDPGGEGGSDPGDEGGGDPGCWPPGAPWCHGPGTHPHHCYFDWWQWAYVCW